MKYARRITLGLFIIIISISLGFNIYFVKLKKDPSFNIFNLGGIYFDISLIENEEIRQKISNFIKLYDNNIYIDIIETKDNPIAKFYAFCGILNKKPDAVPQYLEKLLFNAAKVNIILPDGTKIGNTELGYAILLLLQGNDNSLIKDLGEKFYTENSEAFYNAYKSPNAQNNSIFKLELLNLISTHDSNLSEKIVDEFLASTSIEDLSKENKKDISYLLSAYNGNHRGDLLDEFLQDKNETVLYNTLDAINSRDKKTTKRLVKLFYKNIDFKVLKLALKKYCMLEKEECFEQVSKFMKVITDDEIRLTCLELIADYCDEDTYKFLIKYLGNTYSTEINLAALKAIIKTTYNAAPADVIKTMNYVLRRGKEELALYTIDFIIDNYITANSATVLYRLRKKENQTFKMKAIKYVKHFNLRTGYPLIADLSDDDNEEISEAAGKFLDEVDFDISMLTADMEDDGSTDTSNE